MKETRITLPVCAIVDCLASPTSIVAHKDISIYLCNIHIPIFNDTFLPKPDYTDAFLYEDKPIEL